MPRQKPAYVSLMDPANVRNQLNAAVEMAMSKKLRSTLGPTLNLGIPAAFPSLNREVRSPPLLTTKRSYLVSIFNHSTWLFITYPPFRM
jgi:hypothetical protein